ncbi:MAG: hypothetical protein U5L03_09290 [Burkholderiaceae bacterium]|nr:hypothetical protein [Burkholderiaceae bacterium]
MLNHAARVLNSSDSALHRDLARSLLRIRDSLAPLPDADGVDDPRCEAHRIARIPKITTAEIDAGPLIGTLTSPTAPPGNSWLRPLRRYYDVDSPSRAPKPAQQRR